VTGAHDLFELDPKEFVAARDALARELKASGDKDGAAAVKALKRPTVPLWALNQVARREPDAVGALVAAAAEARAAQDAVLGGGKPDELRGALTRRRDAAAAVARDARAVLRESGRSPESHEREIEEAIDAATATDEGADLLRRGELSSIPDAAASGDDTMLAALLASSGDVGKKRSAPARKQPSKQLEKARAELDARRRDAEEAMARLEAAERTHDEAQRAHEEAQRAADRATKALARAEDAVRRLE
jgi:hypothetical protein